jgi:serine/threonine-protein kinase
VSDDLTGKRLGHYRIDAVLGRGGMSVMYRATDMRLGRKVALKVISEHLTEDPEFRERFVDEARNTAAIDHSNVVPLLYIAMRLVDGSDLASLIKDGPLPPSRALILVSQAGEALDMLAGRGLVHLDVKPANMLVTSRESAGEHVYLADFGLTRRGATGHRTRGGDFLGSPTYAAPEHLRGEPVDGRTDLYSLACVLFACLTGRPPYQGNVSEVIQGHLGSQPPAATKLVPSLPAGIDDVIRKGMAKDPKQRYANCRELVAAARSALVTVATPGAPAPMAQPPVAQQHTVRTEPASGPVPVQAAHVQAPVSQPFPSQPQARPYQPAAPGQPQYGGYPPQSDQPVRLRPPTPINATAFREDGGAARWAVPILAGTAVLVLLVVLIVWLIA